MKFSIVMLFLSIFISSCSSIKSENRGREVASEMTTISIVDNLILNDVSASFGRKLISRGSLISIEDFASGSESVACGVVYFKPFLNGDSFTFFGSTSEKKSSYSVATLRFKDKSGLPALSIKCNDKKFRTLTVDEIKESLINVISFN